MKSRLIFSVDPVHRDVGAVRAYRRTQRVCDRRTPLHQRQEK